ncbi:aminoglycoside phosphotransferase family protein [Phenylobacterium sp.]|uniref:aminoglycoside phosphotransferase family protein n=1 Tax=Phenylobacterium sp. TaxID=1871053 RepID=UPI003569E38F
MTDKFERFAPWLARWELAPDGEPFETGYSRSLLMPVRRGAQPAMLKLAADADERRGAAQMTWWAGDGAAPVLAHQDEALLMVRLEGPLSLAQMARDGRDGEASRILCAVADRLHAPRPGGPPGGLVPLERWFRALAPAAAAHGGVLAASLETARALFAEPREPCVLHGDLHHANVLDGGALGWRAIDPKGLFGERGYDYANILCNPDEPTAVAPGRLVTQAAVIAEAARLPLDRVLAWTHAHTGASAAWCIRDGFDPGPALAIAEIAQMELAAVS